MDAITNVSFLQGDFTEPEIYGSILTLAGHNKVDLVLCDMAPNICGIDSVDRPRALYLAECAADFCIEVLIPDGSLLVKLFHGTGFDDYVKLLRNRFCKVLIRKPEASRSGSREVYALATKIKI